MVSPKDPIENEDKPDELIEGLSKIDYEALYPPSEEDAKQDRKIKLLVIAIVCGLSALNWQPLWHQLKTLFAGILGG